MDIKLQVKGLDETIKKLSKLKDHIKPEVVDKGLDAVLTKDLTELKQELLSIVNEQMKTKVSTRTEDQQDVTSDMPKSDTEIIKHLTGLDISKFSDTKDFSTLTDSKVALIVNKTFKQQMSGGSGGPTSRMSSGVNLRLTMDAMDTFDTQYAKAVDYFNTAMFVFVDNGITYYYVNPGIDMTNYVKVVCSRDTGNTPGAQKRWDTHAEKRGYADWTLLSPGVDLIKDKFIKLNDVADAVKEGDYDKAQNFLNRAGLSTSKTETFESKLDDLKKKQNLAPSVQAYNNIVRLVRNLKLEKKITKSQNTYILVSAFDETIEDYSNFQDRLREEVLMWKIDNEQRWVQALVGVILNVIKDLLR